MAIEKIDILGVGISVLNLETATTRVLTALAAGSKGYICVTGVHGIIEAQDDPDFLAILNDALLCTPDGMPTVLIGKFCHGKEEMGRVYGPDLMWEIFRSTENTSVRHFLYGGAPGVAERLAERLGAHFPGATIAGTWCPPFRELTAVEEADLEKQLTTAKADIMWIGLSTPKQEKFMARYLGRLPITLMVGVGAAFDFHAGRVSKAPPWIQQSSLEWLYRLTREPARLWPRYRRIVPRFLFLFARQLLDTTRAPDP